MLEILIPILFVVLVGTLLAILKQKPEKSAILTGLGILMTFVIGLTFTMLIPSFNENWSQNTAKNPGRYHAIYSTTELAAAEAANRTPATFTGDLATQPNGELVGYTAQQERGRRIYQREGCMYCHSQQIRPLANEIKRYSIGTSVAPIADEREYIWDQPHFLGTRRIGPDLSREGGKYSDDWHYSHFYYPRQMVPGSIMPAFTWLFDDTDKVNPKPKQDARDLVAYVQTLGYGRQVPDGHGGWRPWLKPEDQQYTQSVGEGQVLRIDPRVNGGKGGQVRGGDQPSPTNRVLPGGTL
jgi:cbb3-type cytochrome oxidase cytochrome c subunit